MGGRGDALPDGAVLVHIGPPKTGTTALQMALHERRQDLVKHGVVYPGSTHRQKRPGYALIGKKLHGKTIPLSVWDTLADSVRNSGDQRVCISSENLARAQRSDIAKLVGDLGEDRVHMILTARRLDRLLPSAWQQRVKDRETMPYGRWLETVLDPDGDNPRSQTFWKHHGLESTIADWREFLPSDRITVIVADESDRTQQLRIFEELLDLPTGILDADDHLGGRSSNTSLSYDRIELLRRFNAMVSGELGQATRRLDLDLRRSVFRAPREPWEVTIPPLPAWAAERVSTLSKERAESVRSSGVRVIGDSEALLFNPGDQPEDLPPAPESVPISVTLATLAEAFRHLDAAEDRTKRKPAPATRPARRAVADTSSKRLLAEVLRRQRRRLRPGRRHAADAG
jgi:hypothetical protein